MGYSVYPPAPSASGSNNFTLTVGTSGNTTYVLDRTYSAGSYKITFQNNDTTYDVYAIAENGTSAGYANNGRLIASADFNEISVLGAASNERIIFEYEGVVTTPTSAGDIATAGAYITSVSDSTLVTINDSTTVTGGNFAPDVAVNFVGQNSTALTAKSVVRSSSTSLIATRPDLMPPAQSPYSVIVTNPGITAPTGSNAHILSNSVTAGGTPTWVTASALPGYQAGTAYSVALEATDADGSISYSLVSGTLPTSLTLNGTTGVISGTSSSTTNASFTIRATDNGGNFLDRAFTLPALIVVTGGTLFSDATYFYRRFTSSGTLTLSAAVPSDILMIGGGGGGGGWAGGGGGAGGLVSATSQTLNGSCTIVIGAGGAGNSNADPGSGSNGQSTTFTGLTTAVGGGTGSGGQYSGAAGSGGSGGGAGRNKGGAFGTGTAGQGNNGASSSGNGGGGGGGATSAGTQGNGSATGGAGSSAFSTWASVTSSGVSGFFAGGGGGGTLDGGTGSAGGSGGGGKGGGSTFPTYAVAGTANTGSGGGGGGNDSGSWPLNDDGMPGGSGIVIVRYTKASVGG
jgi:hypothetical protein